MQIAPGSHNRTIALCPAEETILTHRGLGLALMREVGFENHPEGGGQAYIQLPLA